MRRCCLASVACSCFAVIVALITTSPSLAGPLPVGGSITFPQDFDTTFTPPTGDVIASDNRVVTVTYEAPEGFAFDTPQSRQLNFSGQVLRDPASGKLTFFYDFTEVADTANAEVGRENSSSTFTSFDSFSTDVVGDPKLAGLTVSRSADGATLTANGGRNGQGVAPTFFVSTDADSFDRNGTIALMMTDEFTAHVVGQPDVNNIVRPVGTATVTGTFEPTTGGGPGPTPIPLPPAVWTGMLTLAGTGLALCRARRRTPAI